MVFTTPLMIGIQVVSAVMMLLAANPAVMGPFVVRLRLKVLGWLAVAVIAGAVAAMLALL